MASGSLTERVDLPVGAAVIVVAFALTAWRPRRFGWQWGRTGEHWLTVSASPAFVAIAVGGYRLAGSETPYAASVGEFVLVPLGEEGLFRGFVLVVLAELFSRSGVVRRPWVVAVAVSALAFGLGHAGNLGYVPAGCVAFQVAVATAFGLLAGWVRVRTASLVGPVLLHALMNVLAVS